MDTSSEHTDQEGLGMPIEGEGEIMTDTSVPGAPLDDNHANGAARASSSEDESMEVAYVFSVFALSAGSCPGFLARIAE